MLNEQLTTYTHLREVLGAKDVYYEYEVDDVQYKLYCKSTFANNWVLRFDAVVDWNSEEPKAAILMTSPSVAVSTLIQAILQFLETKKGFVDTFTFETKNACIAELFQVAQEILNKKTKNLQFTSYLKLGYLHKFLYIKKGL